MDVLCLGQITADVVVRSIQKVPEKGKSEFVDKMELHNGGCACNTAIGLAKIGIRTGVMGKVGRDGFVAGFLTGIVKGWDLKLTGEFANAVGGCVVTSVGAAQGIKSLDETLQVYENHSQIETRAHRVVLDVE